jgi:K+-transporting ATPase A subunit
VSGSGVAQILVYLVVLTALGVPLGRYMTWVFERQARRRPWIESGFLRLVGSDGAPQDWKRYAQSLIARSTDFAAFLGTAVMLLGRFVPIVFVLALAGSLSAKRTSPTTLGTFRADSPTFAVMLWGVILIMSGLSILPSLVLGPIAEGLS